MSNVHEASAVLAKWRKESIPLPPGDAQTPKRLALVSGTAANVELLDALEGLLWRGTVTESSIVGMYAELIADAILSVEERMNA